MIHVHRIHSLDVPELGIFRTMRRQEEHRKQGIFVAESDKVVRRLLESPFKVLSVLLPEHWFDRFEALLHARHEDISVYLLEKKELEKLTGFTFYQGVLAVGQVPEPPALADVLISAQPKRLLVAVEGITNAENLGSLVRNGAAFGMDGLLLDQSSCSPYLRRAVRASMGTVFRVPAWEGLDLVDTIRRLRGAGIRCLAAHPGARERLSEVQFGGSCCVVFGSEGYGLTPGLLEACDAAASIPMVAGVDSLNVGSAAAVCLYEWSRQSGWR